MKKCVLLALLVFCGVLPECLSLEKEVATEALEKPAVAHKVKESLDAPDGAVKEDFDKQAKDAVQAQNPILADNREAKVIYHIDLLLNLFK